MIILVTGGREYSDRAFVFSTLDRIHAKRRIGLMVCGACTTIPQSRDERELRGADRWALEWAWSREVDFNGRPARWAEDGYPQAGPMRNRRMYDEHAVDLVVAFSGGSGTDNAVSIGRQRSVKVLLARQRCTCASERGDEDCAFCSKLCLACAGEGCTTCKGTGSR